MEFFSVKRMATAAIFAALATGAAMAQDTKVVLGISEFTSEVQSPYTRAVTEKVVQVVTNAKRFIVVDRTSLDKVKAELELQKSEAFLDSDNTVKQDAALAAHQVIVGHIIKLPIIRNANPDGSVNGYKANVSFTLKVNDVETGRTTEAETFTGTQSTLKLSPESALDEALTSLEKPLMDYLKKNFPLTTKIAKIKESKKNKASVVLISGGKSFGFNVGDKILVEIIEIIDGQSLQETIGTLEVINLAGDFSECAVKDGGEKILSAFNANKKLICKLQIKEARK